MKIPFCHWTQVRTQEPLVLVDVMGQLPSCYAISSAAIVAGSFSSHNGGHNVLEPCLYGCPVLFGPHMHAQREFARIVLQAGVGKEVSCDTLAESIIEWLESTIHLRAMAFGLIEKNRGSLNRTFQLLQNLYIPRAVQKSGLGKEAV